MGMGLFPQKLIVGEITTKIHKVQLYMYIFKIDINLLNFSDTKG